MLQELPSFLDILKHEARNELVTRVNNALSDVEAIKEETRLDIFQITITYPYEPKNHLWCTAHLAPNPANLVICEFEEYSSAFHLIDTDAAAVLPVNLVHLLGFEASPLEEFEKAPLGTANLFQRSRLRDKEKIKTSHP